MERLNIETTQNVLLEFDIANIGERMLAYLIDVAIMFFYMVAFALIGVYINHEAYWVFYLILQIPVFLYSLIFELVFHGQTPGKMILKTKVVKADGTSAGIGNYLIRWIFRLVDIWIATGAIGVITILVNGKGQRLGDLAAGTTVVKLKKNLNLQHSLYKILPDNYQLVFPQVKILSEKEISIVNEILNNYLRYRTDSALNFLKEAVQVLQRKMEIKSDLHPKIFVEIIIKDYNYIHKE